MIQASNYKDISHPIKSIHRNSRLKAQWVLYLLLTKPQKFLNTKHIFPTFADCSNITNYYWNLCAFPHKNLAIYSLVFASQATKRVKSFRGYRSLCKILKLLLRIITNGRDWALKLQFFWEIPSIVDRPLQQNSFLLHRSFRPNAVPHKQESTQLAGYNW